MGKKGQFSSLAYKRMYAFLSSLLLYSCFVDKSQGAPHVSQISLNLNLNLSVRALILGYHQHFFTLTLLH
ncbi:putative mannosyl-oligosaccharide glucosidase [Fusarium oxysporum f. sp. albedinis]|nr:putative mannosyl-oligosaccharide glucosidase [Fusarium oxysporum f. sp. albedinis]